MRFGVLAAMSGWQTIWALLAIGVCGLIVLVVLLQRGRGGGLSGAFGGGGSSSAFGAKTGDVFTVVTVVLTAVFLVWFVVGNYAFAPGDPTAAIAPAVTDTAPATEGALPLPTEATDDDSGPSTPAEDGDAGGDDEPAGDAESAGDDDAAARQDAPPPAADAGDEQP